MRKRSRATSASREITFKLQFDKQYQKLSEKQEISLTAVFSFPSQQCDLITVALAQNPITAASAAELQDKGRLQTSLPSVPC